MKTKVALLVVALVAALGYSTVDAAQPSTLPVVCTGSDAASQGSLSLVGGSIHADVIVTGPTPEVAAPGDLVTPTFSTEVVIAPDLIDTAIDLLGVSSVTVSNATFNITAAGAGADQVFTAGPFNETIPVTKGAGLRFARGPFVLNEYAATPGIASYRLSPLRMTVAIGSISVNVVCSPVGSNVMSKTVVRDPDAPLTQNATIEVAPGSVNVIDVSQYVTPGKTPIIPDSYKLIEGDATMSGSTLNVTAPDVPGTYTYTYEVCGEPKPDGGEPGVNEVVLLNFSDHEQNKRPVAFSLKVGDVETPLVHTHTELGWPFTTPAPNDWFGHFLTGTQFQAPTASAVQVALAAAGFDAVVTGTWPTFGIEFVGTSGEQDVPDVSVGQWYTVLPYEWFEQITELVNEFSAGTGSSTPSIPDDDAALRGYLLAANFDALGTAIQQRLLAGVTEVAPQILAFLVDSFYQKPVIETVNGEPPVPAQPLCTQGQVDLVVVDEGEGPDGPPTTVTNGDAPATVGDTPAEVPAPAAPISFVG